MLHGRGRVTPHKALCLVFPIGEPFGDPHLSHADKIVAADSPHLHLCMYEDDRGRHQ